jgi:hypothetical protein
MRATVQNKKGMYAAQHEKKEVCMRRIPAQHVGNTPGSIYVILAVDYEFDNSF